MPPLNCLDKLAEKTARRLSTLGYKSPRIGTLRSLIDLAFHASIRTEEGRHVGASLTFADPDEPDVLPPMIRADYPRFSPFDKHEPLTVESLVKLSRAVDRWTASIAVFGSASRQIYAWGIVDQIVHSNVRLQRESRTGFANPGVLTIDIDGIGMLSIYHAGLFLCGTKGNRLYSRESNPFYSPPLLDRIAPQFDSIARAISSALPIHDDSFNPLDELYGNWVRTVCRICIGLRRLGTGGTLLITPEPVPGALDVKHGFRYARLGDSLALSVLDDKYWSLMEDQAWHRSRERPGVIPGELFREHQFAVADMEDRQRELTGAIKMATSLAAADGLLLLTPRLGIAGFGAKITAGGDVPAVFAADEYSRRGMNSSTIDVARFGTRHSSIMRYCQLDEEAIGVVISQDGHVRIVVNNQGAVVLWENVKIIAYEDFSARSARRLLRWKTNRIESDEISKLGYTLTPKTLTDLLETTDGLQPPST